MQPNPIKSLVLVALLFVGLSSLAATTTAPSVTLAWDQVTDSRVNGYNVYYGVASRQYTNTIFLSGITNTNVTIGNLERGTTYFFAATSVITSGPLESDYSVEVSYTTSTLPPLPRNVTIKTKTP